MRRAAWPSSSICARTIESSRRARPNDHVLQASESGRREGFPSRLPHHRTCGSAYGGSWQSLRTKQHSFSATLIAAQSSANRLHRTGNKTTDGRVLPAKFSPSRVVRPSGVFVSGSLLSVLWPLLTPVPARRPLLAAVPAVAGGFGLQASLSKNANSRCTTGPFISGTEHRTALCGASLSAPST